ncbi:hypothetical protein NA56DRAFT_189139 [Hyaloscypha hepaticicola]|uniref:Uncharacterized protein n=1 Tax=Hyaloscypha hepaticicola TaxID=2082293 RepID=A0A2J6Q0P4_9HELO|nr:hypothetical protein NA56DRAFT_189139 [Hyaloscypha hepaticicola]
MRQVHSGTFTEAQLPTLVSDSAQPVAEIFHTCPLCDGVPEDVVGSDDMNLLELSQCLQGHIEKHLISLATLSLIWQPLDYSDTPSISEGSSNVALWSTGSVIARNELTNTVSLDFIDRGRVDIIPDPEIDENHAKQAYVVPIDWNEYQIGLTKPQPNVQDHTIASFASHLRKQQQERNTESFRNQSPSSTEDPSLEYSFQPCSYCVDILKIMRNVLNLSTESSAKGIVFEHHATVSILKKSAQDGCSLCGVFSNELDLSPIEKDDIVKYSLSLVWHEREQTRILVLESAQEEIWLELYCDRGKNVETFISTRDY